METIWKDAVEEQKPIPIPYTGTNHTKVAIIGAGMAGILTAYLLKEVGVESTILEADTLGCGQTGDTIGKITSQHGTIYSYLEKYFGKKTAFIYARANENAIGEYDRIIKEQRIDCDFKFCPAYLYAVSEEGVQGQIQELKRETEVAKNLGISSEFTTRTELPFFVEGAEVFYNQARFHPLKFINHLAKDLNVYEHSPVHEIKDNCLFTEEGILDAEYIVFTSHYPWPIKPDYYLFRMHQERNYVLALQGENEFQPNFCLKGMYHDIKPDGVSLQIQNNMLLLNGNSHHNAKKKEGDPYDGLRAHAKQWYPKTIEMAHWSVLDCMTIDRIPYIGYLSGNIPNRYVATGFGKWDMTGSMVAATILRDMILGKENKWKEVFSPQRMNWRASFPQLWENIGSTVVNLSKRLLPFH